MRTSTVPWSSERGARVMSRFGERVGCTHGVRSPCDGKLWPCTNAAQVVENDKAAVTNHRGFAVNPADEKLVERQTRTGQERVVAVGVRVAEDDPRIAGHVREALADL